MISMPNISQQHSQGKTARTTQYTRIWGFTILLPYINIIMEWGEGSCLQKALLSFFPARLKLLILNQGQPFSGQVMIKLKRW